MARPFVKHLISNVKAHDGTWQTPLGRYTLIIGPNRSRKTAIVQGLELALSGAVDDVGGKDNAKVAAKLLTLSPDGQTLRATAEFTSGHQTGYLLEKGSRAETAGLVASALAHRFSRDLLTASKDKVNRALLTLVTWDHTKEAITEMLPGDVHAKYGDIMDRMRKKAQTEGEAIDLCLTYVDTRVKELNAQAKVRKTVLDHLKSEASEVEVVSDKALQQAVNSLIDEGFTPQGHMAAVLNWAVENGMTGCPTCSSAVGPEHLQTCATWAGEQPRYADASPEKGGALHQVVLAKVVWEMVEKTKKALDFDTKELTTYKALQKSLKDLIAKLVKGSIRTFLVEAEKLLPEGWALGFNGTEVGLLREDRVFSALSGAERAAVVVALAGAYVKKSLSANDPAVLILEDRAWDGKTLASVMRTLKKFDGQVIIQTTTKPSGRMSKDWTILESTSLGGAVGKARPAVKHELNSMQTKMLEVLGYTDDDLGRMSSKSVSTVLMQGWQADSVEILNDGAVKQVTG